MKNKYYKCSVETNDEYGSIGFILKDNKKNYLDKLEKFFRRNNNIKYDGVFLPLTECNADDLKDLNYVFKESLFGMFLRIR